MADEGKKHGRPRLTEEEKAARAIERKKYDAERFKKNGYSYQKKYRETHRGTLYEPKIRIPIEYKPVFDKLLSDTNMSITELCLTSLEEKYHVILHKHIDKINE